MLDEVRGSLSVQNISQKKFLNRKLLTVASTLGPDFISSIFPSGHQNNFLRRIYLIKHSILYFIMKDLSFLWFVMKA